MVDERPTFKVDMALMKLEREYKEAGLSDDERTRRLAEAKKDIEQELRIDGNKPNASKPSISISRLIRPF
jgi:hypothetical protein